MPALLGFGLRYRLGHGYEVVFLFFRFRQCDLFFLFGKRGQYDVLVVVECKRRYIDV